ncbi:MAG: D-alanyl-lipoteichoic acid biosynthesis protein DltB [Anaerovoracaceae bacterium]
MSFFEGIQFYLLLMVLFIPAIVLGFKGKPLKAYRIIISIGVVGIIFWPHKSALLFLLLFYGFELLITQLYMRIREKEGDHRKPWVYRCFLVASILPLALSKMTELSGVFSLSVFQFIGISYLTFRVAQIVIETYDGLIKEMKIADFTEFLMLFTTFSSGPIDRSRRFIENSNRLYTKDEYGELLGVGLQKLLVGIIYKFILATAFHKGVVFFVGAQSLMEYIGYSYSYGFYLFFDFAGYSAMAIGASYILGIKVPDNFNKPFISIDIKDFWNRWHMTLSFWFRDFLFSRFMMLSIKGKWFSSRLTGASIGFIVNMFIMGVWHGLGACYILYGIYHGVLLALTEVYQKKSKFYKAHKKQKWYRIISWFVTINLVMFGFLLFSGELV